VSLEIFVSRHQWLVLLVLMMGAPGLTYLAAQNSGLQASPQTVTSAPALEDPDESPSEFNHHVAGYALISVGLLVIVGHVFPRLRSLQFVWPALFLFAGVFLAAWSDSEIWPRGNLSWGWLLHHDPEARQHKIYALLLIAIGLVEYLRARICLRPWWQMWAFPVLALAGAGLLLVHDHSRDSGVRSPEVRAYLINPALGPDGKPNPASSVDPITTMPHDPRSLEKGHASNVSPMDHAVMNMGHSGLKLGIGMQNDDPPVTPHSHMTPAARNVENQHFWFVIVGFAIAVFKLIDDSKLWRHRFVPQSWPSCIIMLGVLLALYRE
jgi:hypothetical protein